VKTCRKCGKEKKRSEFRLNRRMRDGLSSWCAACHREATRRWRADHRDEINEARRGRRQLPSPRPLGCSKSVPRASERNPIGRAHLLRGYAPLSPSQ